VRDPEQLTLELEEDDFGAWVESLPLDPGEQGREGGEIPPRRPRQDPSHRRRPSRGRGTRERDVHDRPGRKALGL
jgi:hypothetical protein